MGRNKRPQNAIGARLSGVSEVIKTNAVNERESADNVNMTDNVNDRAAEGGRPPRTTVSEPGPRRGLQPGWTRATIIVQDSLLATLKDIAYTERRTLKDVINEALTRYVDSRDLTGLLHKE